MLFASVVLACCGLYLPKLNNVASENQTFLKPWILLSKEHFLPRYVCDVHSTCSTHLGTKVQFINGHVVSFSVQILKLSHTIWPCTGLTVFPDERWATLNMAKRTKCECVWSDISADIRHRLFNATSDVPQRMDQPQYLAQSPLYNKGALYSAVIWCSVQQAVVVVVHAATASDQDEERKAWSSMCWQFTEKPSQTSASQDNSTRAMADLQGHFTLWLWCILTCTVCQGLGSATLKVWQLVDAKYWIIYGRTNKFQATADSGAEWFLMGSWSGNLGC